VFQPSLGYAADTNSLDFHLNRVLVSPRVDARSRGVTADLAQVLFDHHLALGPVINQRPQALSADQ
jgi:hypothetical protein